MQSSARPLPVLSALGIILLCAGRLPADVHTWDGGGVLERWDSAINWAGNNLPSPGDDLVWNANGFSGYETDNDFASGTGFRSITCTSKSFDNTNPGTAGWVHEGNLVVLGAGGLHMMETGGSALTRLKFPIRLSAQQVWKIESHLELIDGAAVNLNNRNLELNDNGNFRSFVSFHEPVSGPGDILISGAQANLHAANTFFGTLRIDSGSVAVYHPGALGSTDGPTVVNSVLRFHAGGTISEPVTLSGRILLAEGAPSFSGPWTLSGTPVLEWLEDAGALITHSGGLSGAADLHLELGDGAVNKTLRFTGTVPNTLTGTITLAAETGSSGLNLELDKISATAIAGPLVAGDGTAVKWLRPSQFGPNVSLTLGPGALAEMNGHSDSVTDLHLLGGDLLPEGGVLSVKGNIYANDPGGTTVTGTLRMQGNAVPHVWDVAGATGFTLTGAVTESSVLGTTVVQKTGGGVAEWQGDSGIDRLEILAGRMVYEGNGAGMDAVIDGGDLHAGGTLRDVLVRPDGGSLRIEMSSGPGPLAVRNLTLNAGSGLTMTITPAPQAHLTASGTVNLNGATLGTVIAGDLTGIGDRITFIRKDSAGPVTGTFAGRPEGSLHTFSRGAGDPLRTYRISYTGGDGNDVTFTLVSVAPTGVTKTWTGFAAVPEMSHPQNWNPQIKPQPGDALVFPDVIRKNLSQDLGPYFPIASVRFTADGYHLTGQPLGILQHVTGDFASGVVQVNTPLRLSGNVTFSAPNTGRLRFGTIDVFSVDLAGFDLTLHSTVFIDPLTLPPPTLHIGDPAPAFQPFTGITGAGSVRKTGAGLAAIECFCDFTGPVTVTTGWLGAMASDALGAAGPGNHTIVNAGATLDLSAGTGGSAPFPEDFFVSGTVRPLAYSGPGAEAFISGSFNVNGTAVVDAADSTGDLYLRGMVTGGTLRKTGPGDLMIGDPALVDPLNATPNSFSRLEIEAGRVFLSKEEGVVAASVVNATGGTLRLNRAEQISDRLSVSGTALIDLFGKAETLNRLDITGGSVSGGAGSRITTGQIIGGGAAVTPTVSVPVEVTGAATINLTDGTAPDDLLFTAAVTPVAEATLALSGGGRLRFDGPSSAPMQIIGGAAIYMGGGNAPVQLLGGMVGGSGPVGAINGTGRVEPGTSPGILASSNVSWGATTTFAPEILNSTAGTGYDQLDVTGTVALGNAILETTVLAGATLPSGTVLTIIKNDGADAVTGTFAGLANNAVFATGGKNFRINYDAPAGTGNDVSLTVVTLGTGVTRVWDGETGNQWSVAANWVNLPGNPPTAPAPGDDLVFPAGAANLSMNNNFAAGTVFNSITVQAAGYTLAGNAVQLNAGMNFEQATGLTTIHLPITMTQPQAFTVTAAGTPQFSGAGAITNNGFPLTLEIAGGGLLLNGFTGTGGIVKTGPGNLAFGNSNAFTGPVTIGSGTASIPAASAGAGAGTAPITISPGAQLTFSSTTGTFSKPVTLGGRLHLSNTSVTLSGAITLPPGNDGLVDVLTTSSPVFSGVISGAGRLEKRQAGTLTLSGTAANTFTGGTVVTEGTLRLQKTAGLNAVPGALTIGDGAGTDTVVLLAANQIANAATVTLSGSGAALQCGTFAEQIAALQFTGGSVTGSAALTVGGIASLAAATTAGVDVNLTLNAAAAAISCEDGPAAIDLQIFGEWNGAPELHVTRSGGGTLLLGGNGTAASLRLDDGLTRIERDWGNVNILLNGGTLGGTGPAGAVEATEAGGVLAPGASADILTTGSVTGSGKMVMTFEIGGLTPGTGHDQLAVTGTFDPKEAELEILLLPGFTPLAGQTFVLVSNDGSDSIDAEFGNAAADRELDFGLFTGSVSYRGGDGNDVALTILRLNGTGLVKTWDGGGADNKWTTAANWIDDTAPGQGDTLEFPDGAPQLTAVNDFAAGTNFERVFISGAGYTLTGARIALNAGVESSMAAGTLTWGVPLTLTQPQSLRATGGNTTCTAAALLDTNGHALSIQAAGGSFDFLGTISGSGGVSKTGATNVNFFVANTFTGTLSIGEGQLTVFHNNALGGGALVQAAGRLQISGGTPMTIPAGMTVRGTVGSFNAAHRINGAITVPAGAAARFDVASDRLDLAGRIQSSGAVQKLGTGALGFIGTLSNTFTGGLTVLDGEVIAGKTAGVTAVPGPVTLGNGSAGLRRLTLAAANQIADGVTVRLLGSGAQFDLAGFAETITGLDLTEGSVTTGAGILTLTGNVTVQPAPTSVLLSGNIALGGTGLRAWNVPAGTAVPALNLAAALSAASGAVLHKLGDGVLAFSGTGGSAVRVQADAGTVRFLGNQPLLDLDLNSATADGTGTLGAINAQGAGALLSPGLGAGQLTVKTITANPATTIRFEINGTTPGIDYDQILSTAATVSDFGGAALDVALGFTPAIGDSFRIVENTGGAPATVVGFGGLGQLDYFSKPGGVVFQINYSGGDGNDIVLTRVEVPDAVITGNNFLPQPGGTVQATVTATGLPGVTYVLETSSNLLDWITADTQTASRPAGALSFQTQIPANTTRIFQRVRLL